MLGRAAKVRYGAMGAFMYFRVSLATAVLLWCALTGMAKAGKTMLDAHLYTTYASGGTYVTYIVCGYVGFSGCFGSGTLDPFEQACAVLEGTPKQKDNIITRAIYILDKRTANDVPITLTVFTRTDTFANGLDSIKVTQTKQIPLGVTGGTKSDCAMAASDAVIYAGTTADTSVIAIDKKSFALETIVAGYPLTKLKSITADERGYVAMHFEGASVVRGPPGDPGGTAGDADMVGTRNAWKP